MRSAETDPFLPFAKDIANVAILTERRRTSPRPGRRFGEGQRILRLTAKIASSPSVPAPALNGVQAKSIVSAMKQNRRCLLGGRAQKKLAYLEPRLLASDQRIF
jgi:hypothetical protein